MKEAKGFNRYIGLMFKGSDSEPLLFRLNKFERTIHSFFCPPFEAKWLDANKKIIRTEKIKPFRLYIRAPVEAVWLIETPY
ncbi:MAG: hypothetical protein PHU12_04445 [Candidatus Aenigmarchaeota archaeon]|nr:hypothetical protein [Candidatus Aenigmarchaeota archaeon]